MIHIGRPFIQQENNLVRLCSKVTIDEIDQVVFYEVDSKYKEFLCTERADCFIVALLHFAMSRGENIESDAPISEKLCQQLRNYLIPTLDKYIYDNTIEIIAELDSNKLPQGTAVGTGLSSGVDSFHTIYTHNNLDISKYNITHLTFFNVGSHGDGIKSSKLYQERYERAKKLATLLDYELIGINSNIGDVACMNFVQTHTFRSFSAVLALQKFFCTYYYASGYPIEEFKISEKSSAYYDLLTSKCLSTENIDFYSAGIEKSRLEKVEQISNYEPSYRYLNVCTREDVNCGVCEKCIRTQLELYSINKLELYNNVFDIQKFMIRLESHLGFMLVNQSIDNYKEIRIAIDKNNITIPLVSYFYAIKFKAVRNLRNLKLVEPIRKIIKNKPSN